MKMMMMKVVRARRMRGLRRQMSAEAFVFSPENFKNPNLPEGLNVVDVETVDGTEETLKGFGKLVHDPSDFLTENGTFEITPWPHTGWRQLDPHTGDEAGTTEGDFEVHWQGDFFMGKNLAIASRNNTYLDGLGAVPENATHDNDKAQAGDEIYLWMSDHHPDGGQLFWPRKPVPFTVCLGMNTNGDDIAPNLMKAFHIPSGKGVYIHPGTWHNGIYVAKEHTPATFLTRQGRVHARVSCSWAAEYESILRVPLKK
jgi:ureidoglycolate lyase